MFKLEGKMYKKRHIEAKLRKIAQFAKVILVVGARQVGKSTLLKHLFPEYEHITFDAFQDNYNVKADPDLFLNQFNKPLILDEIQYQPELVSAIKRKVDESDQPGQYFLTGSQNFSALKNMAESLAGRVVIMTLYPMTPFEMFDHCEQHWLPQLLADPLKLPQKCKEVLPIQVWRTLWQGGFPKLLELPEELIPLTLQSYLQTYIERDIRLLENIQDLSDFDRFIRIVAALTGQEINASQLGREIGISPPTANRWLNLLSHTYQWNEIYPYHGNTIKRISKKSKGIVADTGMACHLLKLTSPISVGSYPQMGALFESHVVDQIIAVSGMLSMEPALYHWRSKGGAEVDIILEQDDQFYPIEIKCKTTVTKQDARGINAFRETYPDKKIQTGVVIYAGERCYQIDENTVALPFHGIM